MHDLQNPLFTQTRLMIAFCEYSWKISVIEPTLDVAVSQQFYGYFCPQNASKANKKQRLSYKC